MAFDFFDAFKIDNCFKKVAFSYTEFAHLIAENCDFLFRDGLFRNGVISSLSCWNDFWSHFLCQDT